MMTNYLSRKFFFVMSLGLFFALSASEYIASLAILLLIISIFYLFRMRKVEIFEDNVSKKGTVLSPVNGKIIQIQLGPDSKAIKLAIAPGRESSVHVPASMEVLAYQKRFGSSRFRLSSLKGPTSSMRGIDLNIKTLADDQIQFRFLKCPTGFFPDIWARSGNRGKAKAVMGFMPLGGAVEIYLPTSYDIIGKVGDRVRSCESLIAAKI